MIVVFDAQCLLCDGWVQFLLRHNHKGIFQFASIQSDAGQALLAQAGLQVDGLETLLLIDGPRTWQHTGAIFRVLGALGWPWRLAWISWLVPAQIRTRSIAHWRGIATVCSADSSNVPCRRRIRRSAFWIESIVRSMTCTFGPSDDTATSVLITLVPGAKEHHRCRRCQQQTTDDLRADVAVDVAPMRALNLEQCKPRSVNVLLCLLLEDALRLTLSLAVGHLVKIGFHGKEIRKERLPGCAAPSTKSRLCLKIQRMDECE